MAEKMTEHFISYLELEVRLLELRRVHSDSPEGDIILDEMDKHWWQLSPDEQDWINRRGPLNSE